MPADNQNMNRQRGEYTEPKWLSLLGSIALSAIAIVSAVVAFTLIDAWRMLLGSVLLGFAVLCSIRALIFGSQAGLWGKAVSILAAACVAAVISVVLYTAIWASR